MIFSATLPAQAAGAPDVVTVAGVYSQAFYSGDTVTDVQIATPAGYPTITGTATNNVTLNVRQLRNGTVVSTFATGTLDNTITVAAENSLQLWLTAQPVFETGDVIDVVLHQNGTGLAVLAGLLVYIYIS